MGSENSTNGTFPDKNTSHQDLDESWHCVKKKVEALIFASDEAISESTILDSLSDARYTLDDMRQAIKELNDEYDRSDRAFQIKCVAGAYRFLSKEDVLPVLQAHFRSKRRKRLSRVVLETLAVIAYKQPISRVDIESIRGISVEYSIRILLHKKLAKVVSRSKDIGKPLLYGTTKEFLDYFMINSLEDLPKLTEIEELMKEEEVQDMLKNAPDRVSDGKKERRDEEEGRRDSPQ